MTLCDQMHSLCQASDLCFLQHVLFAAFDVTISVLHKYFCPHCVHTPATPLSQQLQHSHVLIL